jgi:DNA repair protein RadD
MDWSFSHDAIYGAFTREPWAHQSRSVAQICDRFRGGLKSLVLGAPTAAGKGQISTALVNLVTSRGGNVIIYNPRRLLTQQSLDRLTADGIDAGARAASLRHKIDHNANVQIAQMQTDIHRVIKQERWDIYNADLVIVDEAHMMLSPKPLELLQRYLANGAYVLGMTGTPIGMSGAYRDIVVAASNSELRACGAHVPAKCFSIHEMDVSKVKKEKTGEYNEGSIIKECWSHAIVGYIYDDWRRLNPDALPTLCASPGIGESTWVSEMFFKKGHKVAHIDCEKVIINGEIYPNDASGEVRNQVLREAGEGKFELLCHCQVIQEGVDLPSLRHLILARPYGTLQNYIQSVGRVIRACPELGKTHCVIQDHGGNCFRHGSPNADRDWGNMFKMNEKEIAEERRKDIQEGKVSNPITCPRCGAMRTDGAKCPSCGHQADPRTRVIIEKDGALREMKVDQFAPPPPPKPQEITRLNQIFFSVRNAKKQSPSDSQVLAIYAKKFGEYPPDAIIERWTEDRFLAIQRKRAAHV